MRLLRGVYNAVAAVLLVGFFAAVCAISGLLRRPRLGDWGMRHSGSTVMRACGVRATAAGLEHVPPEQGFILVANHESHFDPIFLLSYIPRRMSIVAKRELFKIPVLAQGMRGVGMVEVNRGDHARAVEQMDGATALLQGGGVILVFAEGHRTETGELQSFKKGGFVMALKAGVPVLPVAVVGTRQVLATHSLLPKPGHAHLEIGAPIPTEGLTLDDRDALMERTREAIVQLREAGRARLRAEGVSFDETAAARA